MNFVRGYPAPHYYAGANLCGSRAQSRTHLGYAEMEQRRRSQRRLKLTGKNDLLDVNADFMATYTMLDHPTLYPSPYVVLGLHGYTKHYYAGTERICAKIGGGFGRHISESRLELQDTANSLFSQSRDDIQHRELPQNDLNCVVSYGHVRDEELRAPLRDMPNHLYTDADIDLGWFHHAVERCEREYEGEDKVFFYHSDHLGSASWITNKTGNAIQHLQYLPFGTPFVDQHAPGAGYSERFTFTGKEKDEETGYGYFGARYYNSEALTVWLSVDPMADKYPSISPYAYCVWNPIKLIDPDGNDWYETDKGKIKWTDCHSQKELRSKGINGNYLGVTVKNGNKYYSLFGKECISNSRSGKLTQALDNAIINHVRTIRKGIDIDKVTYEDFSDIYLFEPGIGGHNAHQGEEYAGGNVAVFVNATNMNGRLESLTSTDKPLGGPFGLKSDKVTGHRFNIRNSSKNHNIIATISFDRKNKADGFASKICDMMNRSIYPTLKQVERVNGRYQQKIS